MIERARDTASPGFGGTAERVCVLLAADPVEAIVADGQGCARLRAHACAWALRGVVHRRRTEQALPLVASNLLAHLRDFSLSAPLAPVPAGEEQSVAT